MIPAVIPVAGYGTRALPASKSIPKEMMPLYDRPIIQYVVEEATRAGAKNIIFVTSKGKSAIEDHFDISPDLEILLQKSQKKDLYESITALSRMIDIQSVRQKEIKGLGHAVWMAKDLVSSSFGVLLGDDIIVGKEPGLSQLVNIHSSLKKRDDAGVVLLMEVPESEISKYGICEWESSETQKIRQCLEKPKPSQTSSRLAIIGRYLLPRTIFEILENLKPGAIGEIQLTDALNELAKKGNLYGVVLKGQRFDAGDRLGFLKANLHYYLQSPYQNEVRRMMEEMLNQNLGDKK